MNVFRLVLKKNALSCFNLPYITHFKFIFNMITTTENMTKFAHLQRITHLLVVFSYLQLLAIRRNFIPRRRCLTVSSSSSCCSTLCTVSVLSSETLENYVVMNVGTDLQPHPITLTHNVKRKVNKNIDECMLHSLLLPYM